MKKHCASAFFALLLLGGCDTYTQTSSGREYLQRHGLSPQTARAGAHGAAETGNASFEQQLIQAANVEPTLTFPARIGLARIEGGQLSAIPGEEAEIWMKAGERLGKAYGEFVPLSPLVANMVSSEVASQGRVDSVMNKIRLGAARQHLDAVLVYETYSTVDEKSNLLAIADLTVIGGYLLPSQRVTTEGYGNAMLIDVMHSYPYGTVKTVLPKESEMASSWGWGSDKKRRAEEIQRKVTEKLSTETEEMLKRLRLELAEIRTGKH